MDGYFFFWIFFRRFTGLTKSRRGISAGLVLQPPQRLGVFAIGEI